MFIDTHIVVWLFSGQLKLLSNVAIDKIRKNDLLISPIVKLELSYLYEIGRLNDPPERIINDLGKDIGLKIVEDSFIEIINVASEYNWTRDPFDRIITAHAKLRNLRLLTKDRIILANYDKAFWD